MAELDYVLGQFHEDLDRAEHLLRLVKEFRKFAAESIPKEVHEGEVSWTGATDLWNSAHRVRTDLPVLSGSILLYICGRFEYFVREVVVALADAIAASASKYEDLSEKIRDEILSRTAEIAQTPGKYGYTKRQAEQFIITLANNLDGRSATGVKISSRVLSVTESNMHSRMLADTLKRVGVVDIWSEIGKQAQLKVHLSKRADRECTAEAISRLDIMMKERNVLAHPTDAVSFPDPDRVLDASRFLHVLSRVIVDLAKVPR